MASSGCICVMPLWTKVIKVIPLHVNVHLGTNPYLCFLRGLPHTEKNQIRNMRPKYVCTHCNSAVVALKKTAGSRPYKKAQPDTKQERAINLMTIYCYKKALSLTQLSQNCTLSHQ